MANWDEASRGAVYTVDLVSDSIHSLTETKAQREARWRKEHALAHNRGAQQDELAQKQAKRQATRNDGPNIVQKRGESRAGLIRDPRARDAWVKLQGEI